MMRAALLVALALAGCGRPEPAVVPVEENLLVCPPGYGKVCEDLGPGPGYHIICSCECIETCNTGECINLAGDVNNCGGCGNVCSTNHDTPSCIKGVCQVACSIGYASCDNSVANGCETNTNNDVNNCGTCAHVCPSNHGTASCTSGVCAISCAPGYSDCNGIASDGCETATGGDINNCGGCGNVCPSGNGTPSCVNGTCALACAAGYSDCDGNKSNGCETSTGTDPKNCGGCGMACPLSMNICVAGKCLAPPLLRTAIVLIDGPGAGPNPYGYTSQNKTNTASMFYSSTNPVSARSFVHLNSYGAAEIVGGKGVEGDATDIWGPYAVPANGCSDDVAAAAVAADPNFNPANYDILAVVVNDPSCGVAATGSPFIGTKRFASPIVSGLNFGDTTFNGKVGQEMLHEFGHAIGLSHSNGWDCQAPAGQVQPSQALNGECTSLAYGDPMDLMGNGGYSQFNPYNKDQLTWLTAATKTTVTTSGTFVLNPYEDGASNLKVLKIPRKLDGAGNTIGYYYVAYHQPAAPWTDWATDCPGLAQGIAIYLDEKYATGISQLLDMTPGTNSDPNADFCDAVLLPGKTFSDSTSGVTIALSGTPGATATVNVTVPTQVRQTRFLQMAVSLGGDDGFAPNYSVVGYGNYAPGTSVALAAAIPTGYIFNHWTDDAGNILGYSPTLTYQLQRDTVIWADYGYGPPINNNFGSATTVATLPFNDTQNVSSANTESGELANVPCGEPNGSTNPVTPAKTIWYKYQSPTPQAVTINTYGSRVGTTIAVYYNGNSVSTVQPLSGACSYWNSSDLDPVVTFMAQAGTPYYIQIGGEASDIVKVQMAAAPANDNFAWAVPIALPAPPFTVDTRNASYENGDPSVASCSGQGPWKSVWYAYTATANGTVTVDVSQSSYHPLVEAFTGSASNILSLALVSQYSCSPNYSFTVTGGQTYFIQISDGALAGGDLVANFSFGP
jgi:hypothetical protein